MRRIGVAGLWLILTGGFYLALIDTLSAPELYAGAGVVTLALLALAAAGAQHLGQARLDPRFLAGTWRALAHVPIDVIVLCREALLQVSSRRSSRGELRAISFRGGKAAENDGRAALAELVGSFAPNTIVIGVDPDRQLLLVHQLHRRGGRENVDVLGLG